MFVYVICSSTDPRTADWPMVKSPLRVAMVLVVYVYFCLHHKSISKKWATYSLKPLLIAYNLFMVALSLYMTYEVGSGMITRRFCTFFT